MLMKYLVEERHPNGSCVGKYFVYANSKKEAQLIAYQMYGSHRKVMHTYETIWTGDIS